MVLKMCNNNDDNTLCKSLKLTLLVSISNYPIFHCIFLIIH